MCHSCGEESEYADNFEFAADGTPFCYYCKDDFAGWLEVEDDGKGFPTVEDFEWMIINNMDWEGKPLD
jgi:hypothetical protein